MWIKGAWRAVNSTSEEDILLCYLDIQAVICWWLAKLTFRHRNIVAINLLLKDKPSIKNRIASWMYFKALSSENFHATVTSLEYGQWLNRKFGKNFYYYHLPDLYIYNDLGTRYGDIKPKDNTVFCGGTNGRDWNMIFKIAEAMPDMTFTIVMPGSIHKRFVNNIPPNVVAMHDVSLDTFLREMASSQIVCLPLDTEAPAGLIVLFEAAAIGRPIVTSSTVTTRAYIRKGMSDACIITTNDTSEWVKTIRILMHNISMPNANQKFNDYLNSFCSEQKYVESLQSIIKQYYTHKMR